MLSFSPFSLLTFTLAGYAYVWASSVHDEHILKKDDTSQLFNVTGLEGLSAKCIQAMESPVSCSDDGMLLLTQDQVASGIAVPEKLTADDLAILCTAACSDSLASLSKTVESACSGDVLAFQPSNGTEYLPGTNARDNIFGGGNETYRPSLALDRILLNYKVVPFKDR